MTPWGPIRNCALFIVGALLLRADLASAQQYFQAIGYTSLQAQIGSALPTGAGVKVSLTEAPVENNAYFPALDQLAGKTVNNISNLSNNISYHATGTSAILAGNGGMGSGVPIIDVYEANNWLDTGYLRAWSPYTPKVETSKVVNASWIGYFSQQAIGIDVTRRLDLASNRDGFLFVSAVNNGSGTTIPQLMANTYNGIVVGLTSGNSSLGPTTLDVTGRAAPQIVAPETFTSYAAPIVGAAATMLFQAAASSGNPAASKPEMIKAMLLGGATKSEFDLTGATPTTFDDWTRTDTRPLDLRYGAGELNIQNSYNIFAAGEQTQGGVKSTGWDYVNIGAGGQVIYGFDILEGQSAQSLSVTATWNRQITATPDPVNPSGAPMILTPSLANVDLRIYGPTGSLVSQSVSTIDNVEHIYLSNVGPGHYTVVANSDQNWNVALTWQAALAGDAFLSVASADNQKVVNFDASGGSVVFADASNGLGVPLDIDHDAQGNRYVVDPAYSRIDKFDRSGNRSVFADGSDGLVLPTSVAITSTGNVFAANYLTSQIFRFDALGNGVIFSDAAKGIDRPFGLAVDSAGMVFAAEVESRRIVRLDAQGNATVFADASDGLLTPMAMALGPDGNLYVADVFLNKVLRIDAFGNTSVFADAADGLLLPTGVAFDASGNLYVGNYASRRILRFDPQGNATVFAQAADNTFGIYGLDIIDSLQGSLASFEAGLSSSLLSGAAAAVPEASSLLLVSAAVGLSTLVLATSRRRG